ncbi:nibrin [Aricia agestis]|uniref:nibrin n=1 Tax=Aricia agestis TaxID=91739 RepID=UPI001C202F4F|nr:nibrin [Aricia agestis]
MWYLTATNDKRTIYVLSGTNITIGRSVDPQFCNFALPDDPSISRKHATLFVSDSELFVQDLGSKYGTFLNESAEKLEHNVKTKLNQDDTIKFGKMNSVWKANKIDFITCTSTLKGDHLQILKSILNNVGGQFKSDWDETCTFLTMPSITLTIKVVLALVQGAHIVNIEFWNSCINAIRSNSTMPDPQNFVPQILESTLNKENVSFLPLKDRKILFAGKQIVFFSRRQFEMYKMPIQNSCGTPLLLSETKMTKAMLCEDDVIVIQCNLTSAGAETQSQKDLINEIAEYLKSKGKRMIADAEIGLAILYCSLTKYCNPNFSYSTEVIKNVPAANKQTNVLAQETQEQSQNIKKENIIIDESLTQQNIDTSLTSHKRKLSDDSENSSSSSALKKFALDDTSSSVSNKRPNEDIDEVVPSKKMNLNDNNDDMFNFLAAPETETSNGSGDTNKMLNLFKPSKRKLDDRDNEDNLFDFVENQATSAANSKVEKKIKMENGVDDNSNRTSVIDEKIDVEALRGSKLQELMQLNENVQNTVKVKKEETELDEKFKDFNLGSTTLVVNKGLIIKREPLSVTVPNPGARNFKKFKKVWPVKMQITILTNSSNNGESVEATHETASMMA